MDIFILKKYFYSYTLRLMNLRGETLPFPGRAVVPVPYVKTAIICFVLSTSYPIPVSL